MLSPLSVLNIIKHIGPKKLDLFEPARLDGKRSIEEVVADLKKLQDEGLFSHIGLSEIKADTLRRASKVRGSIASYAAHTDVSFISFYRSLTSLQSRSKYLLGPTIRMSRMVRMPFHW